MINRERDREVVFSCITSLPCQKLVAMKREQVKKKGEERRNQL